MGENDEKQQSDPFAQMVQFYDDWTKTWASAMSGTASSKGFADTVAQQMESSLSSVGLVRRQMADLMEQSLQQMSLPTRKDLTNLAQRMTAVEMRLDDIEAKLDEVLDLLKDS